MEELTVIEKLLSEDNFDNIVLYDDEDNELEFEQIALIPLDEALYAILKPAKEMEGVGEDEALVFLVNEVEESLDLVVDEEIGTAVFDLYYALEAEDTEEE